ncbi:hypothetical protein [Jiella sonneratiae]|uniref:Uncharacterized protein n=1 Tax=Jiella sonneratiae TaxID=2816856 RepID=A0ABS3J3H1_9HYPH|nr:hypothetical protein [Jiella sonneratiae]MBO0904216.1 hypothetical protein [Jiella sonneratiae]
MTDDPFLAEVRLIVSDLSSPEAQSARLATFAAEEIAKAQAANAAALGGRQPDPRVTVDGRQGAPLATVRPDGKIVADFDLGGEVIEWIGAELLKASPVLTGAYQRAHRLFVDGVEHTPGDPLPAGAKRFVFLNLAPYSRKIEGDVDRAPLSSQAPAGVFEVVAAMANRRFGNTADIRFGWEAVEKAPEKSTVGQRKAERASRTPAIIVRLY